MKKRIKSKYSGINEKYPYLKIDSMRKEANNYPISLNQNKF